jgi:magnesium chelatase family protein
MPIDLLGGTLLGVDGLAVRVEVDVLAALPAFQIVGLAACSVREAKERVRSAIEAQGFAYPRRRITVNLAPADLPKSGTALDLPIGLCVLACGEGRPEVAPWPERTFACGELSLDGALRPVRGALPLLEAAARAGCTRAIVPAANAAEAALVPGIRVLPVVDLREAYFAATGEAEPEPARPLAETGAVSMPDLLDVRGMAGARRAVEIAAAGRHGLLLEGPPGAGKSFVARRLPGILPALSDREALDVTRIQSAAGLLREGVGLVRTPMLRAPHHTASYAAMVGGGAPPLPGEVTLAHRGVLLLDEAPEFARPVLEALRQPLEDREVTVARAGSTLRFPADFQLVATRNPCPCGFAQPDRACACPPAERERYARRLSGPLLDRIDLVVWVDPVRPTVLLSAERGESSAAVRGRVESARAAQSERHRDLPEAANARVPADRCVSRFDAPARRELEACLADGRGSARGTAQLVRVAGTIADLAGSDAVRIDHIREAQLLAARRGPTASRFPAGQPRPYGLHEGHDDEQRDDSHPTA